MNRRGRLAVLIPVLCCPFLLFSPGLAAAGAGEKMQTQKRTDELDDILRIINLLEEAASFWQEKGRFQERVAEFSQEQVVRLFQHLLSEGNPGLKSLRLKITPGSGWRVGLFWTEFPGAWRKSEPLF